MPKPEQAQALVQHLAEQTVQLNQSLALDGDRETLNDIRKQLATAATNLERSRNERDVAAASGSESPLGEQINNLSDLIARTDIELMRSKIDLAEEVAREDKAESIPEQARVTALTQQAADYARQRDAASATLATVNARKNRADQALKTAQAEFDTWTRRVNETDAASGSRTERLRAIDPGIVPQQRSFPNPSLFVGVVTGDILTYWRVLPAYFWVLACVVHDAYSEHLVAEG